MAEIKVPKSMADQLENDFAVDEDKSGGVASQIAVASLESNVSLLAEIAQEWANREGLPGFSKLGPENYSKITSRWLEKRFPMLVSDKSIDATFITATVAILGLNLMELNEKNKVKEPGPDEKETD